LFVNNDYVWRADLLSTFSFTFAVIFAIMLLVGLILLFTEVKPKTTPQLQDAQIRDIARSVL
jgi:hypothetical protein